METLTEIDTSLSIKAADNIRILSAAMVEKAASGHPGGPMGGADFVHILYSEFLNYDPDDMEWDLRDRFYLDAGHMSAMLYAQQTLLGNYSLEDIKNFRQWGSPTPGHPELDLKRGIENTSGPLGLGHTFGIGSAIAERFLAARFGERVAHKTFIYISDGGVQEEISQGAGRIAGHLGLGNVIMFYDANDIQLSSKVEDVMMEDTAAKYEAWGWQTMTIEGNNHAAIRQAIRDGLVEKNKPTLIIGKTIMGKGVVKEDGSGYEGEVELHGKPLSKSNASFQKTISALGGNPSEPFEVFDEVKAYYNGVLDQKRQDAKLRKEAFAKWEKENEELASTYKSYKSNEYISKIDWPNFEQVSNKATRDASGAVLSHLAQHVPNMIVMSADLCNSDKTEKFLNHTSIFRKGDFKGAFLQVGVAELTMAAIATGMSLHGGVVPACATFFAFSDYMKPAMRVAALMEVPVIFLWTHDAFRVGEDGPTHQPIEHEAQLRLLEKLKNHSGHNSFLVLRPADAHETTVAWKMALENKDTPTGMIFSRQAVQDIAVPNRYENALQSVKGAYIVEEDNGDLDIILVANGSEVSTIFEGAKLLREKGLKLRIVSVPSEGRFRSQDKNYQSEIFPVGIPVFGLTAGLPVNLEGLVGNNGKVHGLDHFGYSAPYKVLDEKFGFTPENVFEQVMEFLRS